MQGRRAVIVAGAGAAILALLLVLFLVLPKMAEVTTAEGELQDAKAEQQTLSVQLNALKQARDEAPQNEATIREIEGKVPDRAKRGARAAPPRSAANYSGTRYAATLLAPPAPPARAAPRAHQ